MVELHWPLHLPSQHVADGFLLDCLRMERKHRHRIEFAEMVCHTKCFEVSRLSRVLHDQFHHLQELDPDFWAERVRLLGRDVRARSIPNLHDVRASSFAAFCKGQEYRKGDLVSVGNAGVGFLDTFYETGDDVWCTLHMARKLGARKASSSHTKVFAEHLVQASRIVQACLWKQFDDYIIGLDSHAVDMPDLLVTQSRESS